MRACVVVFFLAGLASLVAIPLPQEEGPQWSYEGQLAGRLNSTNLGVINSVRYRLPFSTLEERGWEDAGLYIDLTHELFLGYSDLSVQVGVIALPYFRIDAAATFRGNFKVGGFAFLEADTAQPPPGGFDIVDSRMGFMYSLRPHVRGMIGLLTLGNLLELKLFDFASLAPDSRSYFFVPDYGVMAAVFDLGVVNLSYLFYTFRNGFSIGIENRFVYVVHSNTLSETIVSNFFYRLPVSATFTVFFAGAVGYYIVSDSFPQGLYAEARLSFRVTL